MYGYVYITKSNDNSVVYIGQHTNHYVRKYQKQDLKYFGSGKIIQNYIKKHGTNSLSCDVLCWCESQDDLNNAEIKYITQYKKLFPTACINIAAGGNSGFNIKYLSAEQRAEIKRRELYTKEHKSVEAKLELAERIKHTLLSKSNEEKAAISKRHSDTWHAKPLEERQQREHDRLNTRANWTAEQKAANSEACRKSKEKPVIITNGDVTIEFPSILECSRQLGWADCMAGMYLRKYNGVIRKKGSIYYNWSISYK